jgi:prepilin-type N-terminal cleavage/methylation domain-containing protein
MTSKHERPGPHLRRARRRGYTLVELMMAIAVFAIGVSGIIAMQKVAAAANEHSKALSVATNIAQAWLDVLKADSSLYSQANLLTNTQLLGQITANNSAWFRPAWNATKTIGAAFDALGKPIDETTDDPSTAQFCVHLRLTQLYPNSPGMNVMRTEVRVFWPRADAIFPTSFCAVAMDNSAVLAASTDLHFLYQVSAVRQQ